MYVVTVMWSIVGVLQVRTCERATVDEGGGHASARAHVQRGAGPALRRS